MKLICSALNPAAFGCSPRRSGLYEMCSYIAGDAPLYSMFRVDGAPIDCPFHGPLAFAYNRGKGECAWPQSQMESCTDPRRVAFHYQACPNVAGSEMRSEFATVLPSLGVYSVEESPPDISP